MKILESVGLHLDDFDDLRIIDPQTLSQSLILQDQLKQFLPSIINFHRSLKAIIAVMTDIEKITSDIRLKALASSNSLGRLAALSNTDRSRPDNYNEENIDQAMKDLIKEKLVILDRLNAELIVTSNHVEDQKQFINCFESII